MKPDESGKEPIACTLDAGAYRERLAWIAELNRSALRDVRREGAQLILNYDPHASASVHEMVRREQKCCAFLRFELSENEKGLTLTIAAPESAAGAFDSLFEPFLTASCADADRCACAVAAR